MKEKITKYSRWTATAVGITLAIASIAHREEDPDFNSWPPATPSPQIQDYQKPAEDILQLETSPPLPTLTPTPNAPVEIPITETPTPTQTRPPTQENSIRQNLGYFFATHYGESYNGQPLGCGTGKYSSDNPEILAVPPSRYQEWPCGTRLKITNPANGAILEVVRHDACPGCGHNTIDLSEKGLDILCGRQGCGTLSGLIVEEIGS